MDKICNLSNQCIEEGCVHHKPHDSTGECFMLCYDGHSDKGFGNRQKCEEIVEQKNREKRNGRP